MKKALEVLGKDPVLKKIIDQLDEELSLKHSDNYFYDLAEIIIFQQLSGKAARTIFQRLLDLCPERKLTAEAVIALEEDQLAQAGVSRQKRRYLKSLAEKFLDGTIQPEKFPELSDEAILDQLTQVKGIGKWSAQIYMMFSLGREDIFPADDLSLRKALQKNFVLPELPMSKEVEQLAERWQPYRSFAALLLWKSLRIAPLEK